MTIAWLSDPSRAYHIGLDSWAFYGAALGFSFLAVKTICAVLRNTNGILEWAKYACSVWLGIVYFYRVMFIVASGRIHASFGLTKPCDCWTMSTPIFFFTGNYSRSPYSLLAEIWTSNYIVTSQHARAARAYIKKKNRT